MFRKFACIEGENQGGGNGRGLAICKDIVESDGPGARFTCTMPAVEEARDVAPALSIEPDPKATRRSSRERNSILAVDDDPNALRYIRDTLS